MNLCVLLLAKDDEVLRASAKRRVTQADVANHAGVSQAMVSYVINESAVSIPQETRQRIKDAMQDLGYSPNVTAQRLRTNKTKTIAGVIPDITNPFYPMFERGIQEVVEKEKYDFIIYNTDGKADKEKKVLASLLQGRVDGVVGSFFHLTTEALAPLIEQNIAIVRLRQPSSKQAETLAIDTIYIDSVVAAKTAVTHLISKGHRRIGMLTSEGGGPSSLRIEGYKQALLAANLQFKDALVCTTGDYNEEGGYHAMKHLLSLSERPTAVFAVNDLMAMGAMLALREAGLSVPDDMSVVGFDDIPSAKLIDPALTSVSQNQKQMGQRAAAMLFERLKGEVQGRGRSEEMPFNFIIRDSS